MVPEDLADDDNLHYQAVSSSDKLNSEDADIKKLASKISLKDGEVLGD